VYRVTDAVMDLWDTYLGHGGTRMRYATHDSLVVEPQNYQALKMEGVAEFGHKKIDGVVPSRNGGSMWCHHEGCVKAKQLRDERMTVR
jgi:hypothetical protein